MAQLSITWLRWQGAQAPAAAGARAVVHGDGERPDADVSRRRTYPAALCHRPGEDLAITVEVTVPAHVTLTGLWLGITNDLLSPGPDGPPDMSPILAARTRTPLGPGVHRFRLHWAVPARLRPGDSRQLSVQWARPNELAEPIIAVLDVQSAPGTSSLIPAHGPKAPPRARGNPA
jgi:hypothetical protein